MVPSPKPCTTCGHLFAYEYSAAFYDKVIRLRHCRVCDHATCDGCGRLLAGTELWCPSCAVQLIPPGRLPLEMAA